MVALETNFSGNCGNVCSPNVCSLEISQTSENVRAILSPHSGFALEQLALELLLFSLLPADQSVFIGMIRVITVIYVHLCSIPAF